jgi:hypothetical protein
MKPDKAKAKSFVRTTWIPVADAVTSLSRTAMRRRAIPRSRQIRTIRTDRRSTPRENQAKAGSEERLSPNSDGREINVDCGLGRPVHICRCTMGRVQHGVASTELCMNNANPSVLTARYRPRMRRAVRPTRIDTTAVTMPASGSMRIRGTWAPKWAVRSAPTATSPN